MRWMNSDPYSGSVVACGCRGRYRRFHLSLFHHHRLKPVPQTPSFCLYIELPTVSVFFFPYNHWWTSWSPLHGSVHHIRPNIFSRLHSQQLEKSGIFLVNTTENRPPPVPRKSSRPPRSTGHKDRPAMPPRWTRPPRPSSISTRRAWSIPASTP